MGEAGQRGMIIQPADHLRMRLVGDVEDDDAAIDIGRIGAVGPLGVDVDVMRAEAGIELLMPHRRGHVVALPGAGQPPASHLLRLTGVTHVNDGVELVIFRVGGDKIGRAAADVHVFAIHEPHVVGALGVRSGAVEERDGAWIGGVADVEQLHACRLQPSLLGLIRHSQRVPHEIQGIRPHLGVRQLGLRHELRFGRIGDIHNREVYGGAFVGNVHDAASISGLLQPHPLPAIAEATQVTVAD